MPPSESHDANVAAKRSIAYGLIALLPVLACFLGGATEKWAEGVVLLFFGLYLLVKPPTLSLGIVANLILLAFCICGAVAFLPAGWFSQPAWRTALTDDFGIRLATDVTPQPWVTFSCLVSLIAGVCWLYTVTTADLDLRSTRFLLRLFAAGIACLAGLCVLLWLAHVTLPFWHNARSYGPFPNRNQTGNIFGLAAIIILACGQDDLRRGKRSWIFWLSMLGLVACAIILSFSRAGILILVAGSAIWLGLLAFRRRSTSLIAVGASFLLLLLTFLLVFGGATLERFHLRDPGNAGVTTDFRWKIFHDALQLIRSSPWCGIGLGNFEAIFAIFRDASFGNTRALHPESDWLWLLTELGWPAVVLVLGGLGLLIWRVFPFREGTNQRYRLAAFVGAMLFALHGLVDVSGHRIGTAFAGIFLVGLALHRPLELKSSRLIPIIFRVAALGLIFAGVTWIYATRTEKLLPSSLGATNARKAAGVSNSEHNFSETISQTSSALGFAPLDWQLYFLRALAEVGVKKYGDAVDDFRRARFLEPNAFEVPLAEAKAWIPTNPALAATAWRDALRRARSSRRDVYAGMLTTEAIQNPELAKILEEVGLSQHDLALAYLSYVTDERFRRGIAHVLKTDPELKSFSETEKLALFVLWSERGDLTELARTVQGHPDWKKYAWLGMAKADASKGDFQSAYHLTQQFGDAVAMPLIPSGPPLEELEKRYASNPDNYATGYALYREQIQRGRIDDALTTARHFTARSGVPAYFYYLEAQAWAAKQNWERAWQAWLGYRQAVRK